MVEVDCSDVLSESEGPIDVEGVDLPKESDGSDVDSISGAHGTTVNDSTMPLPGSPTKKGFAARNAASDDSAKWL